MRTLPTSIEDVFDAAASIPVEETIRRLKANDPSLTEVTLSKDNVSLGNFAMWLSEGLVERLVSALAGNSTVRTVRLRNMFLHRHEGAFLTAVLGRKASVTDLYLGGEAHLSLSAENEGHLADLMRSNSNLKALDLQFDKYSTDGIIALSDAIKENKTLTDFGFCKVGNSDSDGDLGSIFGSVLRENSTLTDVDLSSNALSHVGVAAIARAFSENKTVQTLDLSYCKIDNRGASYLATNIMRRPVLFRLNAHKFGTRYRATGLLRTVYFLTGLDLEGNYIDEEHNSLLNAAARVRSYCWTMEEALLPWALERCGATRHLDVMFEMARERPEVFGRVRAIEGE